MKVKVERKSMKLIKKVYVSSKLDIKLIFGYYVKLFLIYTYLSYLATDLIHLNQFSETSYWIYTSCL